MRDVDADVWVLTEAHTDLDLGDAYRLVAHSGREDAEDPRECWVGIWSRVGGETFATSDGDRTAAVMLEGVDTPRTIIYGTVLPWLGSPWRNASSAGGEAYAASLSMQGADWRACTESAHLCVAGDLNQDLLQSGHYYGSAQNRTALRGALSAAGLSCPTAMPDDLVQRHTDNAAAGIDHVCLSSGLSHIAASERIWPKVAERTSSLSDHFGASVRFLVS